jgi:uncharacterized protein (TIGR02757 family)
MQLSKSNLKEFLDEKSDFYNNPAFIVHDPISIPHQFIKKEDIEISGFLTATISWGNRKTIIQNAKRMMDLLDNSPYEFIMNIGYRERRRISKFVHRTFNTDDFAYFLISLQHIYKYKGGIEAIFNDNKTSDSLQPAIHAFCKTFFELDHQKRMEKHVSDPLKGSAAKRINMYLRWMVRNDGKGVDFGLWKTISPSILSCPIDLHSGNVARQLGLISHKQNDARAVRELDQVLRQLDANDPVKYDFALFGMGVNGGI